MTKSKKNVDLLGHSLDELNEFEVDPKKRVQTRIEEEKAVEEEHKEKEDVEQASNHLKALELYKEKAKEQFSDVKNMLGDKAKNRSTNINEKLLTALQNYVTYSGASNTDIVNYAVYKFLEKESEEIPLFKNFFDMLFKGKS